eukprot:TRINITY_DN19639_c0_g1_i1.p1 TRINITY_DN19639_c0_g1~~TRINITY_DN19639_c0_g1_i1.p1  ORF type:complete len:340 (+),score=118.55 TRINITY_DN19639_c0_g1_i1:72-1091(+)
MRFKLFWETMSDFDSEEMVRTALHFLQFAHQDSSLYAGKVTLNIVDDITQTQLSKHVTVNRHGEVIVEDAKPSDQPNCTVTMSKHTFLGIISGYLDPMMAFMTAQIRVDDPIAFADFIHAFELSPRKVTEFQTLLEQRAQAAAPEPETIVVNPSPPEESVAVAPQAPAAASPADAVPPAALTPADYARRLSDREKLIAMLARGGLKVIAGFRVLSHEIDDSVDKIKANDKYKTFSAKVREAATSSPALTSIMDAISTEIRVQGIDRTFARSKQSAADVAQSVVVRLMQAAHPEFSAPPPSAAADAGLSRKQQLERKLAELQAKNKVAEEERLARLSRIH